MKLPAMAVRCMLRAVKPVMQLAPDETIKERYLNRWWLALHKRRKDEKTMGWGGPRSRLGQVYLHRFEGPDDDRALHDHPWWNVSIVLEGEYLEVTETAATWRKPGDVVFRKATAAHRIAAVAEGGCTTLFITGPKVREWGFRMPNGFVPWRELQEASSELCEVQFEYGGRTHCWVFVLGQSPVALPEGARVLRARRLT